MVPSLRTIAILMLLAGVSLGVFAGTLVAGAQEPAEPALTRVIEEQVAHYRDYYDLDPEATDRLRHVIQRYRRNMRDELMNLYRTNRDTFQALTRTAEQQILRIVEDAGGAGAPSED